MVLQEARARLAELVPLADELNKASDLFAAELTALEADLARVGISMDVELETPFFEEHRRREYDERTDEYIRSFVPEYCLAYGKWANKDWRILVRRLERDSDDKATLTWTKPLTDVSRELRVAAAGRVGDLIAAIASAAKETVANLRSLGQEKPKENAPARAPAPSPPLRK